MCSLFKMMTGQLRPSDLSCRVDHVDPIEPGRRRAMRYGIGLGRLPFAVVECAAQPIVTLISHLHTGIPELPGIRLVGYILQHAYYLTIFYLVEHLSPKLEIVSLLIDRERAISYDIDTFLHVFDHIIHAQRILPGTERDIRHTLELHVGPALRIATSLRFLQADDMRLVAD